MSMHSSPSSRSYLVRVPGVTEAGGTLREMLGSLRNLDQLVRSMRVGPKGLERAILDVYSACEPCSQALRTLLELLSTELAPSQALSDLGRFTEGRLAEATQALETATRVSMTAKNRLALEQVLGRVLPELEAGRDLLELLVEAAWAPAVPAPLLDLLSTPPVGNVAVQGPHLEVKLDASLAPYEVELPPASTQACIGILASAYRERHGKGPVLQCRAQGSDLFLELNPSDVPGNVVLWPLRPLVEPSLGVAVAGLQARGCTVQLGDHPRVQLPQQLVRAHSASG